MSCSKTKEYCYTRPPVLWDPREKQARYPRTCCECGDTINPFEYYESVTGKHEKKWFYYRTCQRCADLRASMQYQGFAVIPGNLLDAYATFLNERGRKRPKWLKAYR